jgi:hypothetical protein
MGTVWSGSPVGTFTLIASQGFGVGANQQIIPAPGAGLAIYLQNVESANFGLGAAVNASADYHAAGGITFLSHGLTGAAFSSSQQITSFPGGFRLPANTALQVNIGLQTVFCEITYTIGPSL